MEIIFAMTICDGYLVSTRWLTTMMGNNIRILRQSHRADQCRSIANQWVSIADVFWKYWGTLLVCKRQGNQYLKHDKYLILHIVKRQNQLFWCDGRKGIRRRHSIQTSLHRPREQYPQMTHLGTTMGPEILANGSVTKRRTQRLPRRSG